MKKILSFQGTSTTAFSYTSPAQIMKSQVKMTSKTHIFGKRNTRKLQKHFYKKIPEHVGKS